MNLPLLASYDAYIRNYPASSAAIQPAGVVRVAVPLRPIRFQYMVFSPNQGLRHMTINQSELTIYTGTRRVKPSSPRPRAARVGAIGVQ
jgi:hypothetical protein